MPDVLLETNLPNRLYRGKVRDIFDLDDHLLIVATDRVSAFDVVLPGGIPRKGEMLSRLSAWWFERISGVIPNHFVALITAENASLVPFELGPEYFGRSQLVRKAKRLDAECIVRGYLAGSGWKSYQRSGEICGVPLKAGLQESDRLFEPIFTPSTKADEGHDEATTYEALAEQLGEENVNAMKLRSIALYNYAHTVALELGIVIADTKFEFGLRNEEVILIDEILTPDSSRFWPVATYRPGGPQQSLDKQPIRDWLVGTGWKDTDPPPDEVPAEVVAATTARYLELYRMLTGEDLPE